MKKMMMKNLKKLNISRFATLVSPELLTGKGLIMLDWRQTNPYYCSGKSSNGGGYYRSSVRFMYNGHLALFADMSCGDFGKDYAFYYKEHSFHRETVNDRNVMRSSFPRELAPLLREVERKVGRYLLTSDEADEYWNDLNQSYGVSQYPLNLIKMNKFKFGQMAELEKEMIDSVGLNLTELREKGFAIWSPSRFLDTLAPEWGKEMLRPAEIKATVWARKSTFRRRLVEAGRRVRKAWMDWRDPFAEERGWD